MRAIFPLLLISSSVMAGRKCLETASGSPVAARQSGMAFQSGYQ